MAPDWPLWAVRLQFRLQLVQCPPVAARFGVSFGVRRAERHWRRCVSSARTAYAPLSVSNDLAETNKASARRGKRPSIFLHSSRETACGVG